MASKRKALDADDASDPTVKRIATDHPESSAASSQTIAPAKISRSFNGTLTICAFSGWTYETLEVKGENGEKFILAISESQENTNFFISKVFGFDTCEGAWNIMLCDKTSGKELVKADFKFKYEYNFPETGTLQVPTSKCREWQGNGQREIRLSVCIKLDTWILSPTAPNFYSASADRTIEIISADGKTLFANEFVLKAASQLLEDKLKLTNKVELPQDHMTLCRVLHILNDPKWVWFERFNAAQLDSFKIFCEALKDLGMMKELRHFESLVSEKLDRYESLVWQKLLEISEKLVIPTIKGKVREYFGSLTNLNEFKTSPIHQQISDSTRTLLLQLEFAPMSPFIHLKFSNFTESDQDQEFRSEEQWVSPNHDEDIRHLKMAVKIKLREGKSKEFGNFYLQCSAEDSYKQAMMFVSEATFRLKLKFAEENNESEGENEGDEDVTNKSEDEEDDDDELKLSTFPFSFADKEVHCKKNIIKYVNEAEKDTRIADVKRLTVHLKIRFPKISCTTIEVPQTNFSNLFGADWTLSAKVDERGASFEDFQVHSIIMGIYCPALCDLMTCDSGFKESGNKKYILKGETVAEELRKLLRIIYRDVTINDDIAADILPLVNQYGVTKILNEIDEHFQSEKCKFDEITKFEQALAYRMHGTMHSLARTCNSTLLQQMANNPLLDTNLKEHMDLQRNLLSALIKKKKEESG